MGAEIQKTKREWTYSLFAQVGLAFVSQLVTVIDFFTTPASDLTIGVGLAINCLMLWMIPVVLGWVYVGIQRSARSIQDAITSITVPVLGQAKNIQNEGVGIRDRTIFYHFNEPIDPYIPEHRILPHGEEGRAELMLEDQAPFKHYRTSYLGFSIEGCELEPGAISNYARFWTHMNAVEHVGKAFKCLIERQKDKQTVHGGEWNKDVQSYEENLRGSPKMMAKYISPTYEDEPNLAVYARKDESPYPVSNCVAAAMVALALQWSSTGGAIIIAYQ